jgi:hypothetical protein
MRREIAFPPLQPAVKTPISVPLKERDRLFRRGLRNGLREWTCTGYKRLGYEPMPIDAATPLFPLHEPLARFFAADPRKRVPLSQVAELLGVTPEMFRATLASEGGRRASDTLTWPEAAGYLFDAWPRAQLLETLGPDHAGRVPQHFHPTHVTWSIPIFIVRAMEHQAAAEWRRDPRVAASITPNHIVARGVHDYVADLLFNEIQPETLVAFRADPNFVAAYNFPFRD